ncbi:MAG: amine dehydrogenase [Gammaproteobacteria bacterium]|nr:amine dehydrogenase [Gammaproteobacteria bacterium]
MKKSICLLALVSSAALAEIAPEKLNVIQALPESYPADWIIAQDGSFFHMQNGKFIVLDAGSDDPFSRFKGFFNGSFIAQFYQSETRPLMYIVETYHSRGTRGERTDVLTVYDKANLAPVGEVVIPSKRASEMPTNYNLQMVDDEKLALIYNFTPAQSVSVVDPEKLEFLGEIPIPGCALVYPMAGRAFASLCGDGTMMSVQLDANGKQRSSGRTDRFFDADLDPVMEKPAYYDGVAYFPTFLGNIIPVDMNGRTPDVEDSWSMVEGIEGGWRPGGISLTATDSKGNLWITMHPDGGDGTHKFPGFEIWVVDLEDESVARRIPMQTPVLSFDVTRDDKLLVATTVEMNIDVYDAQSGDLLRTLSDFGQQTPFLLHGAY